MIRRIHGVEQVAPTAILGQALAYRTGRVPPADTGGRAAGSSLLATLRGTIRQGAFFNAATDRLPVTVLGYQAAQALGVSDLDLPVPPRVLIGGQWFAVAGIFNQMPLAPEIDRSALVGFPGAARLLGYDGHPSRIYVQNGVAATTHVASLIAPTAAPGDPSTVAVSQPSAVLIARLAVASSST